VTRVVSGAVLFVVAIAVVWFAPPWLFLIVAEVLLVLGCTELASMARASGIPIPVALSTTAAALTAAAFAGPLLFGPGFAAPGAAASSAPTDVVLMTAVVALGAAALTTWNGGPEALASSASALFPALYLGLPIGAMIAVRQTHGREALFLLMITVIASDTAQYYSGRAFGRTPLAARISPKKTMEGAAGGFVFGAMVLAAVGVWWLPEAPVALRALLGVAVVALGIAGDLFESMLKRSAGVKDSSALIPGHGGVLDRIDALLFAAPVYYIVLKYV
jgi:phosphatidate cytidylyltransferase